MGLVAKVANVVVESLARVASTQGHEGLFNQDHEGKVRPPSSPVNFLAVSVSKQTCASCMRW